MITITRPADCPNEIDEFYNMVKTGAQIPDLKIKRIIAAEFLIRLRIEGKLVGVAAIKNPDADYKRTSFYDAQSDRDPDDYPFELGYIFVSDGHEKHGYGTDLIKNALDSVPGERIYTTSRQDNDRIHRRLRHFQFIQSGQPYDHNGHSLVLHVRD